MTLTTTTNRMAYTGDGATKTFAYTFKIISDTDLLVYVDGVLQVGGYSVTGAGTGSGGNVVFVTAPALDASVVILRRLPKTQGDDYIEGDKLPAATIEGSLDKIVMIIQDAYNDLNRSIAAIEAATDLEVTILADDPTGLTSDDAPMIWYNSTEYKYKGWNGAKIVVFEYVDAKAYGAKFDAATDDTVAIDDYIDAGENINLPYGTGMTTGGHIMDVAKGQEFVGMGEEQTTIKKSTGTSDILTLQTYQYQKVKDLTFDSNSLGGIALKVKGAYHSLENLRFENCGGTSYPFNFNGVNSITGKKITILSGYGGLNIDGTENVNVNCEDFVMDGASAGDWLLKMTYVTHGTFNNFAFDDAPAGYGFIVFNEYNYDVHFVGGYLEVGSVLNAASVIKIGETGNNNISFKNQLWSNAATNGSYSFLENVTGELVVLDTIWCRNTGTLGQIIKLGAVKFTSVKEFYLLDDSAVDFRFIKDASTTKWTHVKNCFYSTDYGAGVPYNNWNGQYITVENSNMKQVVEVTADYLTFINVSGDIDLTNAATTAKIILINCIGTITDPSNVAVQIIKGKDISPIGTLANDATPSISAGGKLWLTGGTTTITDIDDGVPGQIITIISEHAITITDGTNIFLNGSANFVMGATDTLTLVQKADGKWYEISRSDN